VKASAVLEQGMALAPNDPLVLGLKGYIGLVKLDYTEADASFNASLTVAPNHPLADVWYVYLGMLSLAQGHLSEALEQFRRALRINDANAIARAYYAWALLIAGENRKAIQVADEGLKLVETGQPHVGLMGLKVIAQDALGEIAQANATLDEALTSVDPQWRALLAPQLALLGREQEARSILAKLDRLGGPPAQLMTATYAALNDGRAFDWIHKAIERHILAVIGLLRVAPLYSELRKDPRWDEVMRHLEAEEAKGRAGDRSSD
jgi:tetratricopeptide (TPR) repeat protein